MNAAPSAAALRAIAELASDPLPILWPLETAIATNPLWDLRSLGFAGAVSVAERLFDAAGYPSDETVRRAYEEGRITNADLVCALQESPASAEGAAGTGESDVRFEVVPSRARPSHGPIDSEVAKWCAAFLGGKLPRSSEGFYVAWRHSVTTTRWARRHGTKHLLLGLPPSAAGAAVHCLNLMGIDESRWRAELTTHLASMPGWAAHAKWRSRWAGPDTPGPALELVDYLAVRLVYAASKGRAGSANSETSSGNTPGLTAPTGPQQRKTKIGVDLIPDSAGSAALVDREVWLRAFEIHYRDKLLGDLTGTASRLFARCASPERQARCVSPERQARSAAAQFVFCIDVRSEGLRRHIEESGDYETFGFAGFFGFPVRVHPWNGGAKVDLCPVLVRPTLEVDETVTVAQRASEGSLLAAHTGLAALAPAVEDARRGEVSPYVLAEASGFALGPLAALRTLAPRTFAAFRSWVSAKLAPEPRTEFDLQGQSSPSDEAQALYAETALKTMGLTSGFAPVVVICGHAATTENNPFASTLDCGACGAVGGARSARIAADVLNRRQVRELLAERHVEIPPETLFVAAEHDTTTDQVTILDPGSVPPSHVQLVEALQVVMAQAGRRLTEERSRDLPGAVSGRASSHVSRRSVDWAQLQPEWGLARNACLIIAPRALSAGVDLQRRAFLHSYDPDFDETGSLLEMILTGPMVVAHWINAAYYFSAVSPDVYGAGDKAAHNVVAGAGVWQGAGGDLRVGLPRQSVFDGERLYHEPMRLLTVIEAPPARIDSVMERNAVVKQLVGGAWVHLVCRHEGVWRRKAGDGSWKELADRGSSSYLNFGGPVDATLEGLATSHRGGGRP